MLCGGFEPKINCFEEFRSSKINMQITPTGNHQILELNVANIDTRSQKDTIQTRISGIPSNVVINFMQDLSQDNQQKRIRETFELNFEIRE